MKPETVAETKQPISTAASSDWIDRYVAAQDRAILSVPRRDAPSSRW